MVEEVSNDISAEEAIDPEIAIDDNKSEWVSRFKMKKVAT